MRHSEREVLVDLVGDDDRVVAGRELDHEFEDLVVEHDARGVVRRVHDDEPGAVGDRVAKFVGVGSPIGVAQRHRAVHSAGSRDERRIRVVVGLERDDLVTRVDEGEERRRERFGRAGRDEHLGCRVDVDAVEPMLVAGDRLAKHGEADARRVLVDAVGDGLAGRLEHFGRTVLIGEALARG